MHEVLPGRLWIGHAFDVREPRQLFDAGIEAVVDLAYEEPPAALPRTIIYCRFPLNDGGGNDQHVLQMAVQCTVDLLNAGTPALVACGAGLPRSPTIAAFALARHLDEPPEVVLQRIAATRTLEVKGTLWNDLLRLESQR